MKDKTADKGYSLVEIMIAIALVAVLVALAIPNYTKYVRKANRAEAHQLLMNWANNQEVWRANNTTYADADDIPVPTHDEYTFTVSGTSATAYTLTATPKTGSSQNHDEERGTACKPLTLNQSNAKTPADCW